MLYSLNPGRPGGFNVVKSSKQTTGRIMSSKLRYVDYVPNQVPATGIVEIFLFNRLRFLLCFIMLL